MHVSNSFRKVPRPFIIKLMALNTDIAKYIYPCECVFLTMMNDPVFFSCRYHTALERNQSIFISQSLFLVVINFRFSNVRRTAGKRYFNIYLFIQQKGSHCNNSFILIFYILSFHEQTKKKNAKKQLTSLFEFLNIQCAYSIGKLYRENVFICSYYSNRHTSRFHS